MARALRGSPSQRREAHPGRERLKTKNAQKNIKYLLYPGFPDFALILGAMSKTRRHTVRFTERQWLQIRDRARQCGCAFGTYVRGAALGAVPRERRRLREERALYHLARAGNNLNQIARRLNSGLPVADSEIRTAIDRVNQLLEEF